MLAGYDTGSVDPLGYADHLEQYQQTLGNTGRIESAVNNHAKIEGLRKNNQERQAEYDGDPYPVNCKLIKSSKERRAKENQRGQKIFLINYSCCG